ncbi:MAG TPA: GNAT family N-acetyltransferase [Acidimicrobiia bacterium]|nr:GNAT family N-acetyltransferase [Acidimicrobiia bacterium]
MSPAGELIVAERGDSALVLVDYGGSIEFAGDTDVTDYHSPLGSDVLGLCAEMAASLAVGTRLNLDSLPAEGAKLVEEALIATGFSTTLTEHDVAMVLKLPASAEGYYDMIGKKDRHELRRKRRRYQAEVGEVVVATDRGRETGSEGFAIEEFIRLHRLSEGKKGSFMTPEREGFFRRLARQPGWRVDYLVADGKATACLFAWCDRDTYYLYNSSYDPELQSASPGLVALAAVIENSIETGLRYFDFLKGSEGYKARLGGRSRPLIRIEAVAGGRK